jgi:Putative beta-barrel porin-2, OmpL-like. bbp2
MPTTAFIAVMLMFGAVAATAAPQDSPAQDPPASAPAAAPTPAEPSPLEGIAFAIGFDGYYSWNGNRPLGRVNLLRAYDVSSNSFSLNQANVIVERAPDVAKGRRVGLRLDLMYGQATETLQGNAANEPRPQVYRNVFQAYGSYVVPLGKGLQVDFGKFASALGFENNYTKDQINYSRSYFFNYLPFYHFGLRTTYPVNDRLALTYWLVNGAQQSEDFNGFKSQAAIITIKPVTSISWNVNYYTGREARDLNPALNPGIPTLPTQPGLSVDAATLFDRSRLHIVDTYASWTKGRALFGAEADYVTVRPESGTSSVVKGGAAYAQYSVGRQVQLAVRYESFRDRSGLFTGIEQNLKDVTTTVTYQLADGMQLRGEWRRDSSDHDFFLGPSLDDRRPSQQTLTGAMVWWFGTKRGTW